MSRYNFTCSSRGIHTSSNSSSSTIQPIARHLRSRLHALDRVDGYFESRVHTLVNISANLIEEFCLIYSDGDFVVVDVVVLTLHHFYAQDEGSNTYHYHIINIIIS